LIFGLFHDVLDGLQPKALRIDTKKGRLRFEGKRPF
jgi:hypothetical protein